MHNQKVKSKIAGELTKEFLYWPFWVRAWSIFFIKDLSEAGQKVGLSKEMSDITALQVVLGSLMLLRK